MKAEICYKQYKNKNLIARDHHSYKQILSFCCEYIFCFQKFHFPLSKFHFYRKFYFFRKLVTKKKGRSLRPSLIFWYYPFTFLCCGITCFSVFLESNYNKQYACQYYCCAYERNAYYACAARERQICFRHV